jgi:hypothetical protein
MSFRFNLHSATGTVFSFGTHSTTMLGFNSSESQRTPRAMDSLSGVVRLGVSRTSSYALLGNCNCLHSHASESGTLFGWGSNADGQLCSSIGGVSVLPRTLATNVSAFEVTSHGLLFIRFRNLFACGLNVNSSLSQSAARFLSPAFVFSAFPVIRSIFTSSLTTFLSFSILFK